MSAVRADITKIAEGSGIEKTMSVRSDNEVARLGKFLLEEDGPVLAVAKVGPSTGKPIFSAMRMASSAEVAMPFAG